MDIVFVSISAFLACILTFFSGFGLGTILAPVLMAFFSVELAIAMTAVVHFFNNIYKLFLVGKYADKMVLVRFGIPAVIAAFLGSWLLIHITDLKPLFQYSIFNTQFTVHPVNLIIALLLIIFAIMDLLPQMEKIQFGPEKLPIGGLLSGFFGGLSGHQGALRSAFLIKAGLSKQAFIGTAAVVSTFVDFTRLSVYSTHFSKAGLLDHIPLLLSAILSAIAGSYLGNILLQKVTLQFVQKTVAILLLVLAVSLGLGWLQ